MPDDWTTPTNKKRAAWAAAAVGAFQRVTGTDDENALADLLGDLRHYADQAGEDFERALAISEYYYNDEKDNEVG